MGIFITLASLILALYFVQLGLRRGAFPVLLGLVVSLLAFLIAMEYYVPTAHLLSNWFPRWQPGNLLATGYAILFGVFFGLFGYIALRFTPEIAPLYPKLDRVAGTLTGVLTGLILAGSLCAGWSFSALAERYPIPKGGLYFRPHVYILHAYSYMTGHADPSGGIDHFARFPGGNWFNAEPTLKGILEKGTIMPVGGNGFWVGSVPQGLKVYMSTVRAQPFSSFKSDLERWIDTGWTGEDMNTSHQFKGYVGVTPIFVSNDSRSAWVAIERELPADLPLPEQGEHPLVSDGEAGTYLGTGRRFAKIYRLRKDTSRGIAGVIGLFHEKNLSLDEVEELAPPDKQYYLHPDEWQDALADLTENERLPEEKAKHILEILVRTGKVVFRSATGQKKFIRITSGRGEYEISTRLQ